MRRGGGSGRAAGVRRSWDELASARAERGCPAASLSPAAEVRAGRGGAGTLLNVTAGAGAGGAAGEGRRPRLPAAPNPPLANAGRAAKRVGVRAGRVFSPLGPGRFFSEGGINLRPGVALDELAARGQFPGVFAASPCVAVVCLQRRARRPARSVPRHEREGGRGAVPGVGPR